MAQLTIYLDEETIDKVRREARRARRSVSEWVREKLVRSMDQNWPEGYDKLFGCLRDEDLQRPPQETGSPDVPRVPW